MSRAANSQWDFGDSFRAGKAQEPVSVSELTARIRRLLEKELKEVRVSGEISGLKCQPSGHAYFVLKDAGAQLNCVLFRGEAQVDRCLLEDGRKVILTGQITVYEPRGVYQLRVTGLELQGAGALQAAFEKLKEKLKAEGLFASERKRPIPHFPRRIGLVTSLAGAAIRDVLHVIRRRNPALELVIAPCRVQGAGAAAEIVQSIALLNEFNKQQGAPGAAGNGLDLILVTRGGGSLEDLWCFNEEVVARAICSSALPVVSAVGHEIDFTISDFVADLRAATPSAAAEIITEGVFSSRKVLATLGDRLGQLARQQVARARLATTKSSQRLLRIHPRRTIEDGGQRVDEALSSLSRCARQMLRTKEVVCENLASRLVRARPVVVIQQRREVVIREVERLVERLHHGLREFKSRHDAAVARLRLLGPEQVMARGYSITMDEQTGRVLRNAKDARPGQRLRSRLKSGEIVSRVERPGRAGQAELPF